MKIIRKKTTVNGNVQITYPYRGKEHYGICSRIAAEYDRLGDMYEREFGISYDDAAKAGWNPAQETSHMITNDLRQFIADKGVIKKEEVTEEVDLFEAIKFQEKIGQ